MKPSCPFCNRLLELKEYETKMRVLASGIETYLKGKQKFWVCFKCKKHWLKSSAIIKETSREGIKPKSGE